MSLSLRYGEDIQGSTFSFDVDVMPGKGGDSSLGSTLIPIFFILIIGWKDDELQRHAEPGLGLERVRWCRWW